MLKSMALLLVVGLGGMNIPMPGYAQGPNADGSRPWREVATIKPTASDEQSSGLIRCRRTVGSAKNRTLKALIA